MKKSYKYRIYPNKEQQEKLSQFFGCSRKMYNLLLDWWTSAYKEYKTNGTPIGALPQPTFYKKQEKYFYLKDCDAVTLATARINLNRALDNYFKSKKGKRKGKKYDSLHSRRRASAETLMVHSTILTVSRLLKVTCHCRR